MLSVIIATDESEQLLVPTLTALVPGATAGLITEVIVADAESRDGTAKVADVAGCKFIAMKAPAGARLRTAATAARAPWLLFLRPGIVPDATWIDETRRFVRDTELTRRTDMQAAVLRPPQTGASRTTIMEALALIVASLSGRAQPNQGLLIAKQFYDALGGHRADGADAETDLLRRLGRRRIVMLRAGALQVAP